MNIDQLTERTAKFAVSVLAANSREWTTKFAIGASIPLIPEKVRAFTTAAGAVNANGEVDVDRLHAMICSGFDTAGTLSLLGGAIGLDKSDAESLFTFIRDENNAPE